MQNRHPENYHKTSFVLVFWFLLIALTAQPVPDFSLPDVNNRQIKLYDYMGKDIIILAFWESCCVSSLPELEKIHQAYDEVTLISICVDDPRFVWKAKNHLRVHKYTHTALFDTGRNTLRRFNTTALPHTAIINRDGDIVFQRSGFQPGDEEIYTIIIEALLEQ